MHMVFIKHEKRIEFVSNDFKGSQIIKNDWEETIEILKDIYRPVSWEVIES